jgi:alpha-L-fucosidase 2
MTSSRSVFCTTAAMLKLLALAMIFAVTICDADDATSPTATSSIVGRDEGNGDPLTLWYPAPARQWTDALAIGNGRLGAMVFGIPDHERQQLNDITVSSGGPQADQNRAEAYTALPEIRAALAAGDHATADKLTKDKMTTPAPYKASYETLGDLTFDYTLGSETITDYSRWLDLNTAITGVEFKVGRDTYRRESFSSHPDHVIVTHVTCSRPGGISFTLKLSRQTSATTTLVGQDTLMMTGNTDYKGMKGNCDYEVQVHVEIKGGRVAGAGNSLTVSEADDATVYLAAGTTYILDYDKNYRGDNPHDLVTWQLAAASAKSYDDLKAAHISDYHKLFNRVSFTLPPTGGSKQPTDVRLKSYGDGKNDPSLAVLYYQMGRYLLISSSREDNPLPSNLQGIWGDGLDLPWKCDYHFNINYEMNYWPSETANLGECHLPALRLDTSLVEPGTKTAKAYWNAPGWVCAVMTNAWGWTAPGGGLGWGTSAAASGWICQDFWEHYAFTRDKESLKQSYPVMKGAALFYLSVLVPDANGLLITSPSTSPENSFQTDDGKKGAVIDGSAFEREVIWDLFTNTIAASKVLGIDTDFAKQLQNAKDMIRPLEIGKAGQIEEWGHDWDMNVPDNGLHHRHVSHLFAAFPGWQISLHKTPELAAAVKKSLEIRGDFATGWSNAWKVNLWARMGDGDHAVKILNQQLRLVSGSNTIMGGSSAGGTYANLFDAHPPFQIDGNFGSTSGIDEMLLQSSERYDDPAAPNEDRYYIDLLPALPSLWPTGSIHGLRARGGFQIDLDWTEGQLQTVIITSVGGTATKLRYGTKVVSLNVKPGEVIKLNGDLQAVK